MEPSYESPGVDLPLVIYVKPAKKISVAERNRIYLKDLAEVAAEASVAERVKNLVLLELSKDKKNDYLVSITDIIRKIQTIYPEHIIQNIGEMDTVVEYKPHRSRDNPYWKWTKIFFVSMVLLTGSSTAIMSFHTDAQVPMVFQNYYKIFFNEETERPLIIDIPYSIGLAVGIIAFFNHFAGKKITDDPTPIEVEMSQYDANVTDMQIDVLNTERIRQKGGGTDSST